MIVAEHVYQFKLKSMNQAYFVSIMFAFNIRYFLFCIINIGFLNLQVIQTTLRTLDDDFPLIAMM